jgi:hypothetical protein
MHMPQVIEFQMSENKGNRRGAAAAVSKVLGGRRRNVTVN